MKPKNKYFSLLLPGVIFTPILLASSLQAQVIFTVTDTRPGETSATVATTTDGSVSSTAAVPTATYIVSGLDLAAFGGGVGESIAFDVVYTQTGGSGVQVNGFGNISVTGGNNAQVDGNTTTGPESITATVGFNPGSSTFSGNFSILSIGFTSFTTGGIADPGTDEFWDITTESGTQSFQSPGKSLSTFTESSFVTLDPVAGDNFNGTFNVQGFTIQVTVVPEPSTALPAASLGLLALFSRRRSCRHSRR